MAGVFSKVYEIVCAIPKGKVLTYGLISSLLEGKLSAQGVGWALKALPSGDDLGTNDSGETVHTYSSQSVPWHRVINSKGMVSTNKRPDIQKNLQKKLLEAEGVVFDSEEKIDLNKNLWLEAGSFFTP